VLRIMRERRKLSQAEVAERMGLKQPAIARLERQSRGGRRPIIDARPLRATQVAGAEGWRYSSLREWTAAPRSFIVTAGRTKS
jgi:transcriptional regulator with XRE-family HTH domain